MSADRTLLGVWKNTRERLKQAGVDTPVLDARMLVEFAAGVARIEILTDPYRVLSENDIGALEELVLRREALEPMSHIVGRRAFWKHDFITSPAVLTPRPETEAIVHLVLEQTDAAHAFDMLDLGVGAGAILLSVLGDRPNARGVGVDISLGAITVAQANMEAMGLGGRVRFEHGEWEVAQGQFDVVVSNPPYVRSAEIALLDPEVSRYEPHAALDGGIDGLDAYRRIARVLPMVLKPGGLFVLELGFGQAEAVWAIMDDAGLQPIEARRDLQDIPRVLWGRNNRRSSMSG